MDRDPAPRWHVGKLQRQAAPLPQKPMKPGANKSRLSRLEFDPDTNFTNVTVNALSAAIYGDVTFASTNQPWVSGNNTFTAIAKNVYGRQDTSSLSVNLSGTNNYSYDLNGNLLTDGTRSFAYDDENQLISVWQTNVWRNDFVYDGKLRRRIERDYTWAAGTSSWQQTNEIRFVYDGNLVIQERDANNTPQVSYTRGNDLSGTLQGAGGIGGLLARTANPSSVTPQIPALATSYYHADGNGNITMLISASQMVVAKYLYDPFGNTLAQSGLLADANTYRFSSKEWNGNSGTYYYLYRFYDPGLQRWVNRDPLSDEFIIRETSKDSNSSYAWYLREEGWENLYKFNHDNPEGYVDKDGRQIAIAAPVIGGGIVAGIILAACEASPACRAALNNAINSIGRSIPNCPTNLDKERERVKKCNEIWFAQDTVCDQLYTPEAKAKCHKDNADELKKCLRNRDGRYDN
jgi:RHS repeat-associated protein